MLAADGSDLIVEHVDALGLIMVGDRCRPDDQRRPAGVLGSGEDGVKVRTRHLRFGPGPTRTGVGVVDAEGEHEPVVQPLGESQLHLLLPRSCIEAAGRS